MSPPRIFQRFKPATAIKPTLDDAKKLLDISAGTNRNLFIAFNLVLVTALILALGITDEQLLLGNTVIPLPFLNVPLPISAFATVVPLVVMAAHFDLLHNLNEHSRKLRAWVAAWEVKYPRDSEQTAAMNAAVSEQLFPFLYDFAWLHANGKGPERVNARLLPGMCWALYCWAPYTVLVIFLIRFADLQDYKYTGWHFLLILLDVAWLYWYWPRFGVKKAQNRVWRWVRKVVNLPWFLLGASSLAGCWTLGLFYLIQMHLDFDGAAGTVKAVIEFEEEIQAKLDIALVPRLVMVDYRIKLDPNHFKVAMLLEPGKTELELWPTTAQPLNLAGRRLGFAEFRNVVMPRVNFSGANLKAARLSFGKLQGADFRHAQLQRANLRQANLWGADFSAAELQGAEFIYTQLQGAYFIGSHLQGAYLIGSNLKGVLLNDAKLHGADLTNAQMEGAYLWQTDLQGTSLVFAKLQGAFLYGSNFMASDLRGATFHAATLPDLTQFSATIGEPDWQKPVQLLQILDEDWIKSLSFDRISFIRRWLVQSELRSKIFTTPTLPPKDSQKFAQAWLATVCLNEFVAKTMLQNDYFRKIPKEITDTVLRNWLETHEECKPYKALAEEVIKERVGFLKTK